MYSFLFFLSIFHIVFFLVTLLFKSNCLFNVSSFLSLLPRNFLFPTLYPNYTYQLSSTTSAFGKFLCIGIENAPQRGEAQDIILEAINNFKTKKNNQNFIESRLKEKESEYLSIKRPEVGSRAAIIAERQPIILFSLINQ